MMVVVVVVRTCQRVVGVADVLQAIQVGDWTVGVVAPVFRALALTVLSLVDAGIGQGGSRRLDGYCWRLLVDGDCSCRVMLLGGTRGFFGGLTGAAGDDETLAVLGCANGLDKDVLVLGTGAFGLLGCWLTW